MRGKKTSRSLTQGEIAGMQGEVKEIDATLKYLEDNPGTSRRDSIDVNALKKQKAYFEKVIDEGKPRTPRGIGKDNLAQEARAIEKKIREGMPTRAEMDHPADHPGAIHKHMHWKNRYDSDIRRYKEIQRKLEPHDPTATDIEKLRRNK